MILPYRTQRAIKRTGAFLLILALAAALIWLCWLLWLGRFVVYTRQGGARLDFSQSNQSLSGTPAVRPPAKKPISIHYSEDTGDTNKELSQIMGYYADAEALRENMQEVFSQVKKLPAGTPVMVDVKSITGRFFYSSTVSDKRDTMVNAAEMDTLIEEMNSRELYTIARLPALRDYYYGLNHVPDGLPTAGGYLWMDEDSCYWLNPASQGTMTYLTQIVSELKRLGFDEVVFYDFYFPETQSIVFKGDKQQALATAAKTLVTTCASEADGFTVSFTGNADFVLPEGRSRLYMENVSAAQCTAIAQQTGLADPSIRLVFLAETHDTRFNDYGVMRPISMAD